MHLCGVGIPKPVQELAMVLCQVNECEGGVVLTTTCLLCCLLSSPGAFTSCQISSTASSISMLPL